MDEISYSGSGRSIRRKLPKRLVLFAVFFVIILLLLGGVVFFVTRGSTPAEETRELNIPEESQEEITISPELSEDPTPTPTEEAKLDKSTLKVSVQNGSGESGVAGKVAEVLRTAGYNVVSTGNADNFEYTDVTIKVRSTKKAFLTLLEKDLSKEYTVGDSSSALTTDASYDAVVIIGK